MRTGQLPDSCAEAEAGQLRPRAHVSDGHHGWRFRLFRFRLFRFRMLCRALQLTEISHEHLSARPHEAA